MGVKDPEILMLGLRFDRLDQILPLSDMDEHAAKEVKCKFASLSKFYLYKKFINNSLPVHLRRSFSFPNVSLIEFGTALRFVVGLEDKSILEQCCCQIKQASMELDKFKRDMNQHHLHMLNWLMTMETDDFNEILKLITPFINDGNDSNFEDLLEFLYTVATERNFSLCI